MRLTQLKLRFGVFERINNRLKKQEQGISQQMVNNFYVQKNIATFRELKGFWSDVGTFHSLYKTAQFIGKKRRK